MEILVGLVVLLGMFAVAAAALWFRDRISEPNREELEQQSQDWDRALQNPNWPFVASEFGGEVPRPFRRLYDNQTLILRRDVRLAELEIGKFVPADDEAFDSEQWFNIPADSFVFATTQFGDPIYVRTSESAQNHPVYLFYHDGSDTEVVESSLDEFVRLLEQVG